MHSDSEGAHKADDNKLLRRQHPVNSAKFCLDEEKDFNEFSNERSTTETVE